MVSRTAAMIPASHAQCRAAAGEIGSPVGRVPAPTPSVRVFSGIVTTTCGLDCAVLFVDLDGFKSVNDTFGHPAGDMLLCEVGRRLTEAERAADTVARFGGDEFALLCEDVDLTMAGHVADRIREVLSRAVDVQGSVIAPRGSTGIALSEPGFSAEDMLRAADAAMYAAKVRGRARA